MQEVSTPGHRFAEAGNELVKGIMRIQYLAHRPVEEYPIEELLDHLGMIRTVCEELVGPYKIIVADLSHEDGHDWGHATRNPEGTE